MLRDFLYLNTDTITSYLSQLEGYTELSIDETKNEQKKKGLKAAISNLGGELGSENSSSTKRSLATTDEAKFQRLFELLEEKKQIQYLDAFDEGIWKQIQRGEILEIPSKIKVPKFLLMAQELQEIMPFMTAFSPLIGNQISSGDQLIMSGISKIVDDKPVPLIFESSTKGYKFFG